MVESHGKIYFTAEVNKVVARYDPDTGSIDWIEGTGQDSTHMLVMTSDQKKILDRKSTRLNSSHDQISYAVFCLKKKRTQTPTTDARPHTPVRGPPHTTPRGSTRCSSHTITSRIALPRYARCLCTLVLARAARDS